MNKVRLILFLFLINNIISFHEVANNLRYRYVMENIEFNINQWRYRLNIINHKLAHTPTDTSLIYAQSQALNKYILNFINF